jgi:multidrug efflux pump subunit AcrA (membrane-fusion protein)
MKAQRLLTLITALLAAAVTLPVHAAGFKCWTNSEGVRECGESVPPEYAQDGHEVLNQKGTVVDEKERAKTPEELEEEKKLAAIEAEQKAKEKEAKRQDTILLQTFTRVEDIERVRDEQILAIESTIKVTNARSEKIKADLDKRVAAAAAEERAGKAPNEKLLANIESLRKQLSSNDEFVAEKTGEIASIRADYDGRIARFKELKAEGK